MKIEKIVREDALWKWISRHLPASMESREVGHGYGYVCCIYLRGTKRSLLDKAFDRLGDVIATVYNHEIELFHPEYFSSFEELGNKYEQETSRKISLKYWEGS